jgi:hypothetical protein
MTLSSYYNLNRFYYSCVSTATISFSIPFWWICDRVKLYGFWAEVMWIVVCIVPAVISVGMDEGFRDRRDPMARLVKDTYHCQKQLVVSSIGDRFISVTRDNVRHVINDECEILFNFPRLNPPRDGSISDAVSKSVREWVGAEGASG